MLTPVDASDAGRWRRARWKMLTPVDAWRSCPQGENRTRKLTEVDACAHAASAVRTPRRSPKNVNMLNKVDAYAAAKWLLWDAAATRERWASLTTFTRNNGFERLAREIRRSGPTASVKRGWRATCTARNGTDGSSRSGNASIRQLGSQSELVGQRIRRRPCLIAARFRQTGVGYPIPVRTGARFAVEQATAAPSFGGHRRGGPFPARRRGSSRARFG